MLMPIGMQTFKLSIPIYISEKIEGSDSNSETHDLHLTFVGPKGNQFGQTLVLQVKVNKESSQIQFYKTVITLTEAGLGNFDECAAVLTQCNGDENAAVQMLIDRSKNEDQKETSTGGAQ